MHQSKEDLIKVLKKLLLKKEDLVKDSEDLVAEIEKILKG